MFEKFRFCRVSSLKLPQKDVTASRLAEETVPQLLSLISQELLSWAT